MAQVGRSLTPEVTGVVERTEQWMPNDDLVMVNLTGHDLTLVSWGGQFRTVPSSGQVRVRSRMEPVGTVTYEGVDIPLLEIVEQSVNLPDPVPDTLYVVSGIVAAKARRPDFYVPSRIVRDGSGRAVGCQALARIKT